MASQVLSVKDRISQMNQHNIMGMPILMGAKMNPQPLRKPSQEIEK